MRAQHAPITESWGYSGKNYGWSLGLKQKKRSVVYLVPGEGRVYMQPRIQREGGDRSAQSALPSDVLEMVETAKRYTEGRAVRMQVQSGKDAAVAKELVGIKMACA